MLSIKMECRNSMIWKFVDFMFHWIHNEIHGIIATAMKFLLIYFRQYSQGICREYCFTVTLNLRQSSSLDNALTDNTLWASVRLALSELGCALILVYFCI